MWTGLCLGWSTCCWESSEWRHGPPLGPECGSPLRWTLCKNWRKYGCPSRWSLTASCSGQLVARGSSAFSGLGSSQFPDLALDSHADPTMARLCIKQSKTDPFRQGVEVFLGRTDAAICPVRALVQYIVVRYPSPGPLFVLQSGTLLTRAYLVSHLQAALRRADLDDAQCNGHSFRIGAATTAAAQGLEDSRIQTLGRWRSDAYKTYIKIPRTELANVSRLLTK